MKAPVIKPNKQPPGVGPVHWGVILSYVFLMIAMLWLWQNATHQAEYRTIPYSDFKAYLAHGDVTECSVQDTKIEGKIQLPTKGSSQPLTPQAVPKAQPPSSTEPGGAQSSPSTSGKPSSSGEATSQTAGPFMFETVRVDDPDLVRQLEAHNVNFKGVKSSSWPQFLWIWILPIGLIFLLWMFLSRSMRGMGASAMRFGQSGAKLIADTDVKVTFNDVAGCEEAKYELQEVVMFLKEPERYQALGAKVPKGVLLVGPPGTGKTLLARAVAGEAKVPFFSISGSEFVEMFVGVGAARVRDLFQQAKAHAPCIVFIDELDAVGRHRGVHIGGGGNDEREQTLNQLLVGLDGFDPNVGIIVLAATNRPDVLDRALLRPGRFDRQVVLDAPDLEGRSAILQLHGRGKPLAADADLRKIAQETPGFSGADLANVLNEAALLTARHDGTKIGQKDLEAAVEKVVAGPERKSRRLGADEKRRVAFHEIGHAVVAAYCEHADTIRKISIVPRGRAALGYTLQLPETEKFMMSRDELLDKIRGLLGGRAAEEIVFGSVTTGAEDDLEHATALVRQMICMYGMGDSVGLVHCAGHHDQFLAAGMDGLAQRECSEQTARDIDQEARKVLDAAYADAKATLQAHRAQVDLLAGELLKRETLDAQTFKDLMLRAVPEPARLLAKVDYDAALNARS
ncbi:MAG TPA: ATP-dependent zinc metalloprotease FtsH [Candidatus Dormibacteraeota bacterium]|nr:ATP-dependent zinc metalloprotease FtsH [Candidatus Dormibacteraeota bacterium]